MRNLIIILSLFVGIAACKSKKAVTDTTTQPVKENTDTGSSEWTTIDNADYFFKYPSSWTDNSAAVPQAKLMLMTDASGGFQDNVNLIVQDLSMMGLDMNGFVGASEQQIGAMIGPDAMEVSERKNAGTANEYHEMVYGGNIQGNNIKIKQHVRMKGGTAYVLTFTTTPDRFDSAVKDIDPVLATFRLK